LIFAPDAETAAALVACRAFWIDGASRSEALELGRHYGLQGAATRLEGLLNAR
jgi:hypothetical protein